MNRGSSPYTTWGSSPMLHVIPSSPALPLSRWHLGRRPFTRGRLGTYQTRPSAQAKLDLAEIALHVRALGMSCGGRHEPSALARDVAHDRWRRARSPLSAAEKGPGFAS